MLKYVGKRLLMLIPVMLGVILLVYGFSAVSTVDPVDQILGPNASQEDKDAYRERLGLDDPILIQYARYVYRLVTQGDLGTSYSTNQPVAGELQSRFPVTIKLALISIAFSILISIPLGVLSAVKQYSWVDSLVLGGSVLVTSFPDFWLALMLISLFAVQLNWVPAYGVATWRGWILPVLVASLNSIGKLIRTTRSSMLETIREDYIRTARAKGQTEQNITYKHALQNSLIPEISTIGNTIGVQLGGIVIVENVFGLSGVGTYIVNAVSYRDYPRILGSVVVLALTFTALNLVLDLLYALVDPRIRVNFESKKKRKDKLLKPEQQAS